MFVAIFIALTMFAGCAHSGSTRRPATCGAGWARLGAFSLPEVDTEPVADRMATAGRTIAEVRITGVDAALANTLGSMLETRAGQVLADAPIAADLRRMWALGVIDDAYIDLDGDRVTFVLIPRPRIGRVVIPRRDRTALGRFDLLAGTAYEPQRIARIADAVKLGYMREGHLDAVVEVARQARSASAVDVCVAASPGPKIIIRSITFPGRKRIPEAELLGELHGATSGINVVGGLFDADSLDFDKAFLFDEYYERGMVNVSIGTVRAKRDGDRLDIEVPIEEGPEFSIGTITLRIGEHGIVAPPRVAIPLAYGELFKRSRVQAARAAIELATGADVLSLTHVDDVHNRIDITFELTERYPWGALRLWLSR
jgi:outer membrane protein assembly factor BamA